MPAENDNEVFCGNIAYEVTEDEIKELFSRVGTVVKIRLIKDKETGRPRGFGFIEFSDSSAASSALLFDRSSFVGKPIPSLEPRDGAV